MTRHVIFVPQNTAGCDYIIGDVHGDVETFKLVLAKLQVDDRLFLVGDLIDRRAESPEIIDLIQKNNLDPSKPKIHSVRGNHEEDFLEVMKILYPPELSTPAELSKKNKKKLKAFLKNGGGWIFSNQEAREFYLDDRKKPDVNVHEINDLFFPVTVKLLPEQTLRDMQKFIKDLPYAYVCGDLDNSNDFVICHADMPLNDQGLGAMKNDGSMLTPKQIEHITNARAKDPLAARSSTPAFSLNHAVKDGRTATSTLLYCGHTAMKDSYDSAIRSHTNTVNLDFSAYDSHRFVLVNHTAKTTKMVVSKSPNFSSGNPRKPLTLIGTALEKITAHLIKQFLVRSMLCGSMKDPDSFVNFFASIIVFTLVIIGLSKEAIAISSPAFNVPSYKIHSM